MGFERDGGISQRGGGHYFWKNAGLSYWIRRRRLAGVAFVRICEALKPRFNGCKEEEFRID